MRVIHWLGAGLSSGPGIRRLADTGHRMAVYDQSSGLAFRAVHSTNGYLKGRVEVKAEGWQALEGNLRPNDVVVSMLPGHCHQQVLDVCQRGGAHFVSSSYTPTDLKPSDSSLKRQGLCAVFEAGLDPGIDHVFAHALIERYRSVHAHKTEHQISFRSYCGGIPAVPNDFRYKFSWSPEGVLKALRSPARWIQNGKVNSSEKPWTSLSRYRTRNATGNTEMFEAYPNRDSLPFISTYQLDASWQLKEFVRGTLRLDGWADAWQPLFEQLEDLCDRNNADHLKAISDQLWQRHAFAEGEADRVVLQVELEATSQDGQTVWHQSLGIDRLGDHEGSAMAYLVSTTVSLAVESLMADNISPGLHAIPTGNILSNEWLTQLTTVFDPIIDIDYLSQ